MKIENEIKQVQWDCIHFVSSLDEVDLSSATQHIVYMDGADIQTKEDLFKAVSESMKFPGYFGHNWDALDECLRDLEWIPSIDGWVLIITGAKKLWENNPIIAGQLISSWLLGAEEWSKEKKPFHLLFVV